MELARYIGISWKLNGEDRRGADCWGLVKLVYKEALGIQIMHFGDMSSEDALEAARKFREVKKLLLGQHVFEPINDSLKGLKDFDLLELKGFPAHVGIFQQGKVLHTTREVGSRLEPLNEVMPLILRGYRYAAS